ncbi:MAG: 4-hydroxy-tetrahydrodipicolinate reductase [Anaerovoracaceae bacterium]|jgi:4-hydroxy-tetrahydrodipicolinate reductase
MKIAVQGTDGHMGGLLTATIAETDGLSAVDLETAESGFDVIIDFSHPANLDKICAKARANRVPAVIATTGYTPEQQRKIAALAKDVPVVFAANFSLGITVMKRILSEIAPILRDSFDMEMVERHHRRKLDAPSGTAKMLVRAMDPDGDYEELDGRSGMHRRGHEIGVSAVRGGTIAGEHTAIFAGDDEVLEIKHTAGSRKIFVNGSLQAARFAVRAKPGLYDMEDVLFSK